MQTKIQHVCLSNVYLNGVERGVIFPNVKKQQQSLGTLLFSKLLFSQVLAALLIIANKNQRNTPFYRSKFTF